MGFIPFSFDPALPHFRGIVTAILMNILISFRWAVNQIIPSISYLTNLDKYAILSFFFLTLLMIWHAFIGSNLFSSTTDDKKTIEINFLYTIAAVFFVFNVTFFVISARLFLFRRITEKRLQSIDLRYGKSEKIKRDKLLNILKNEIN
jgi:hypothetical protein